MIQYSAPSANDIQALKDSLGYSSRQMADLASVSGGQQWRKYTGGAAVREINMHMLFFIAARLALTKDEIEKIVRKMQQIGAQVDVDDLIHD